MFNIQSTTTGREVEGAWSKFKGSEFLLASSNSIRFQRIFGRLQRPHAKQIERKTIDPSVQLDLMCEALAKAVLLDWKNVVNDSGEQVPYSQEVALSALKNNSEFRSFVIDTASDIGTFTDEDVAETVK